MVTEPQEPAGIEPLPPLHQRWADALLAAPIPAETRATCHDCAMCSPAAPSGDAAHFNPRTKCCTYLPRLANFLVGQVLLDDDPVSAHGLATVRARIHKRSAAVSPLGLGWPRAYKILHDGLWKIYDQRGSSHFGKADALRCPHYVEETGGCGVWKHREATCAIWFCKHVRGATGQRFWADLATLLSAVERSLARWCLAQIDPANATWRALEPPREHLPPGDAEANEAYRAAWGDWLGREEDLYVACASLAEPLAWSDVLTIGGPEIAPLAERAREAHGRLLADDLPTLVQVSSRLLHPKTAPDRSGSIVRLPTYSEYDPIEVPAALAGALVRSAGPLRPTGELFAALAEEGSPIDDATARKLVDFEVLVEMPPSSDEPAKPR